MAEGDNGVYHRTKCVLFRKTNEAYGGLSNMAGGYPLVVNGVSIRTSEALYQACRFPDLPDAQKLIIAEKSPMAAKMRSKPYREHTRTDWDRVRVRIMRWCLRVKLAENWSSFCELLRATGDAPIVEESRNDDFWGAIPQEEDILAGENVLGRLLTELREDVQKPTADGLRCVAPPAIAGFLLYGEPILPVYGGEVGSETLADPDASPAEAAIWRLRD